MDAPDLDNPVLDDPGKDSPAGDSPGWDQSAYAWRPAPQPPVVGPTAALRGRAGGPGFVPPAGAVPGLYDPAHRSGWQLAQEVWQDSGIVWEQPEPGWRDEREEWKEREASAPRPWEGRFQAPPPPAFTRMPLGAPTMADAPDTARPVPSANAEAMYRAWQGSVHAASARPEMTARPGMTTGRRRHTWQVLRVGVPAAVIVAVGAGAVMMLTGKTNEMLADRGNQSKATPGTGAASSAAGLSSEQGVPQASPFSGYPGQRGSVLVNSIASAGATQLAVGGADGHPAIWHRGQNGAWSLVSAAAPAVYARPGVANLTSVAYGRAGWIAVGDVVSGAAQHPVVLTSADGVTWRAIDGGSAFAGPGVYVSGVAAGRDGYVVVGRQVNGRRTFAAMWWSADLRNWIRGGNGHMDGRLSPSQASAVTAAAVGWVAVGTHGHCHTIWTTADGRHWMPYDVPVPKGSSTAFLRMVTANGTRVVAAGNAVTPAGDIPIVVVSEDGGKHWHQIVLSAPDGLGTVMALTAAGTGFVAAGQVGPAGAQHATAWGSPDGSSWSAATPIGGGSDQVTALAASGGTVTGITEQGASQQGASQQDDSQQGASPSVLTLPVP